MGCKQLLSTATSKDAYVLVETLNGYKMKIILIAFLILFIGFNCYADKYKKIKSSVETYEQVESGLSDVRDIGEGLHAKGRIVGAEYEKLKAIYNRKYDLFVETAYMLEEIIIIEGDLTMDGLIVRMSDRKCSIDDIGERRYDKTVDELILEINTNLKVLSDYIVEVYSYYGKKQRQEKKEVQRTVR